MTTIRSAQSWIPTPHLTAALAAGLMLLGGPAVAGPADYAFDWVTVGDAGNPGLPHPNPNHPAKFVGAVSYDYRLTRTEVTNELYIEFLRAIDPYYTGDPHDTDFLGFGITRGFKADGTPGPFVFSGPSEHWATRVNFESAARFANWMHNGRAGGADSFERGAYDLQDPNNWIDTVFGPKFVGSKEANAKFWIPSLNEMIKAAYYDPNRYGPGEGGYWQFPNQTDEPLLVGPPGIGETIGDQLFDYSPERTLGAWDIGQYPGTTSAYGLLDISGTIPSWTDTVFRESTRYDVGSLAGFPLSSYTADPLFGFSPGLTASIRLAAPVPTVPAAAPFLAIYLASLRRRKRHVMP